MEVSDLREEFPDAPAPNGDLLTDEQRQQLLYLRDHDPRPAPARALRRLPKVAAGHRPMRWRDVLCCGPRPDTLYTWPPTCCRWGPGLLGHRHGGVAGGVFDRRDELGRPAPQGPARGQGQSARARRAQPAAGRWTPSDARLMAERLHAHVCGGICSVRTCACARRVQQFSPDPEYACQSAGLGDGLVETRRYPYVVAVFLDRWGSPLARPRPDWPRHARGRPPRQQQGLWRTMGA